VGSHKEDDVQMFASQAGMRKAAARLVAGPYCAPHLQTPTP
jgi:hypothetical protein